MSNNYNKIAGVYDFMSRLIFGNAIVDAQVCLLEYVPANSSVLIAGGGTGWILEELAKLHPQGLAIDYVEASSAMIALAQKRGCKKNQVNFIHQPVENYITENRYGIILTPFFFDNFSEDKIQAIFSKLNALLKNDGIWLFADFVYAKNKNPLWQKLLLKTMYFFFRATCCIEAGKLINMDIYFAGGYSKIFEAYKYSRFIKSTVYKKQ